MTARWTRTMLIGVLALSIIASSALAESADSAANRIVGQWLIEEDGEAMEVIEIYPCGEEFCGKIVWTANSEGSEQAARDVNNPEEELRDRPLLGLEVLTGYSYQGDGSWREGELYVHRKGKTLSPKFTLVSQDTLKAQVKFLFISKSFDWVRVSDFDPESD